MKIEERIAKYLGGRTIHEAVDASKIKSMLKKVASGPGNIVLFANKKNPKVSGYFDGDDGEISAALKKGVFDDAVEVKLDKQIIKNVFNTQEIDFDASTKWVQIEYKNGSKIAWIW